MHPISHTAAAAMKAMTRTIGAPCAQLMKKSASAKITMQAAMIVASH